jgi:uncharacterized membrane protein
MSAPTSPRIAYVDLLRGVAIVLMVLWHTTDAWLREEARFGLVWRALLILGGLAAPIFFVVLGMSLSLRSQRLAASRWSSLLNLGCRGLELVAWGYLLRVQFWLIDDKGLLDAGGWQTAVALVAGYPTLIVGLRRLSRGARRAWLVLGLGVLLVAVGLVSMRDLPDKAQAQLLCTDVLQALGVAMIGSAMLRTLIPWTTTPLGSAVACAAVALLSWPLTLLLRRAPYPLRSRYLVGLPLPPTGPQSGRFPLLPWMALPFGGAALGATFQAPVGAAPEGKVARVARRRAVLLALVGAVLVAVFWESLPHARAITQALPGLAEPARLFFRLGVVLAMAAGAYALPAAAAWWLSPVITLGRCSLFLYWVHLELVFGKPTWFIHHKLPSIIPHWLAAWLLAMVVVWLLARLRLAPWARLISRSSSVPPTEAR